MTNAELDFYKTASAFFARYNRSNTMKKKVEVCIYENNTDEEMQADIAERMKNRIIIDVKPTALSNGKVMFTIMYTEQ